MPNPTAPVQDAPTPLRLLDHERLDAYRIAVELDAVTVALARKAGRGHSWVTDQACRAMGSVLLNIAESSGRTGADRARHLRIARGSIYEVDAALTVLAHRAACASDERAKAKELAVRVAAMVSKLIQATG